LDFSARFSLFTATQLGQGGPEDRGRQRSTGLSSSLSDFRQGRRVARLGTSLLLRSHATQKHRKVDHGIDPRSQKKRKVDHGIDPIGLHCRSRAAVTPRRRRISPPVCAPASSRRRLPAIPPRCRFFPDDAAARRYAQHAVEESFVHALRLAASVHSTP
jgi:hypothetical protein